MNVSDEVVAARRFGVVHCGLSTHTSLPDVAREFGLSADPGVYHEIDAETARHLLRFVLHQDLAYGHEVVPAERAAELVDRFLAQFPAKDVHYFTNGSFHEAEGNDYSSVGPWNPATAATFDTGVLVIGARSSGCLWVEDED